jgi:hypothetical protein
LLQSYHYYITIIIITIIIIIIDIIIITIIIIIIIIKIIIVTIIIIVVVDTEQVIYLINLELEIFFLFIRFSDFQQTLIYLLTNHYCYYYIIF